MRPTTITYETTPLLPLYSSERRMKDMGKLPSDIKLSPHARERLEERKNDNSMYNKKLSQMVWKG
jgi:hypothetical protein